MRVAKPSDKYLGANAFIFWGMLACLAAILSACQFGRAINSVTAASDATMLNHIIAFDVVLPRHAMALICGAGLGVSGLLLQQVLRNALAEPSTLGIAAGAQLAMTVGIVYLPAAYIAREWLALAGGLASVTLVLALNWKRTLEPASVILCGMIVSLTATTASTALILANGEYVFSLFVWGGGSLEQQSWEPVLSLGPRVLVATGLSFVLLRPLTLLSLDNTNAKSLGLSLATSRLIVIAIAVWLASSITAEVGILGFVGLIAPALAQLSGARRFKAKLLAAPAIGAILLWLTDGLVVLVQDVSGDRLPTGAATALLGGPLLLWMLPRLRIFEWPSGTPEQSVARRKHPALFLLVLASLIIVAIAVALWLGRGPDGWTIASGPQFHALLQFRAPRLMLAALSGAMLALAGAVLQRMTGNPLASPEVLGVGLGAGAGLAVVLLVSGTASLYAQWTGAAVGAMLALVFILTIAARSGFGAGKLLLAGVGLGAMVSSILTAIIATGSPQAFVLLSWLSGTGTQVASAQLWIAGMALVTSATILFGLSRWLDLLPLGNVAMQSLGLPVVSSRLVIVLISALLTAIASMMIGPLSFIGLIAPHLARNFGLHTPRRFLLASMMIGAFLMILTDWLARMAAFPYNLPLGLFASLIGGICLVYVLSRR